MSSGFKFCKIHWTVLSTGHSLIIDTNITALQSEIQVLMTLAGDKSSPRDANDTLSNKNRNSSIDFGVTKKRTASIDQTAKQDRPRNFDLERRPSFKETSLSRTRSSEK